MPDSKGINLSIVPPSDVDELDRMIEAAAGASIDVTFHPALLGHRMKSTNTYSSARLGRDLKWSTDENHAATLVQAEIVQVISSLLGEPLNYAALLLGPDVTETQVAGANRAVSMAVEEGLICGSGVLVTTETKLSLTEALRLFDCSFLTCPHRELNPEQWAEANSFGISVVASEVLNWGTGCPLEELPAVKNAASEAGVDPLQALILGAPGDSVLLTVSSVEEVEKAMSCSQAQAGADAVWAAALAAWAEKSEWEYLLGSPDEKVRFAAQRRLSQL
jgi:hypothetical protein